MQSGMECLWRAASLGHMGALYVKGIILLLNGGEFQQEGMKIMSDLKNKLKHKRRSIRDCREKLTRILGGIWTRRRPPVLLGQSDGLRATCCASHQYREYVEWTAFQDVNLECEACICDQEVASVSKKLLLSAH